MRNYIEISCNFDSKRKKIFIGRFSCKKFRLETLISENPNFKQSTIQYPVGHLNIFLKNEILKVLIILRQNHVVFTDLYSVLSNPV